MTTDSVDEAVFDKNPLGRRWLRGLGIVVAFVVLNLFALGFVAHHLVCPERHAGYSAGERYCRSFAWSALNYAGLAVALAVGILWLPKLWRSLRLVLVCVPAALFWLVLWDLTEQASDLAAPETADKVEWRSPHEAHIAWGGSLLAFSLLGLAAWKRRPD